eukprot:Skav221772  [mRNA]  locus=scaffold490:479996:481578:- [translate_table: standard]
MFRRCRSLQDRCRSAADGRVLGDSIVKLPINREATDVRVWALGVILYALCHGRQRGASGRRVLPFGRPDRETCAKIESDGPGNLELWIGLGTQRRWIRNACACPRLSFKETATPNYRRIVRAMLTPRPEKRAFVDEITLDSWDSWLRRGERFGGSKVDS